MLDSEAFATDHTYNGVAPYPYICTAALPQELGQKELRSPTMLYQEKHSASCLTKHHHSGI